MKPLSLNKPHLVIMVGIPGSGKSFFAEQFAETFKAPIVSLDIIRKELLDQPSYNREEDEAINRVAIYMLDEFLKAKQTIVFEGQTDSRTDRLTLAKKAKNAGFEPLFIWVQTEIMTSKKRSVKPSNDKFPMTLDQFDLKCKHFSAPLSTEKMLVISGKHTYISQLKIVLKHLVKTQTLLQSTERPVMPARPSVGRNILIR